MKRAGVHVSLLNFFSNLLYCLNCVYVLNDLEGWSETKLHCHQKVVVLYKTQGLPINLMLEKFVHVCFVAKSSKKFSNIFY